MVFFNLRKNVALAFDEKLGIPNTKINFACDFFKWLGGFKWD